VVLFVGPLVGVVDGRRDGGLRIVRLIVSTRTISVVATTRMWFTTTTRMWGGSPGLPLASRESGRDRPDGFELR